MRAFVCVCSFSKMAEVGVAVVGVFFFVYMVVEGLGFRVVR